MKEKISVLIPEEKVNAKITAIDFDKKRVSLSIRALLQDNDDDEEEDDTQDAE